MKRIVCGVKYLGSRFYGWQIQSHVLSVQAAVEKALAQIASHTLRIHCAGRTDRGVHALGQVIHFDTSTQRSTEAWLHGGNAHLPDDVALTWACEMRDPFHARFSAVSRQYRYVIFNGTIPPVLKNLCTWVKEPLDAALMHESAQILVGEHDFSSFRGRHCQAKTTKRCVLSCGVSRSGDFIYVDVVANAFLQHMVRNMVGTLIEVGKHKQPMNWLKNVLLARDRSQASVTAAASGLYFVKADYPPCWKVPQQEVSVAYAFV